MDESNLVSLEAYPSVRVRTRRSIFEVSLDGTAHMRQLAAYLMMAAGEQLHFQKEIAFRVRNVAVAQFGKLGLGAGFPGYEALVEFLVALQPVFQHSFLPGGGCAA